jgi:hypothetical protein
MSGTARAHLSNGKKTAAVLEFAPIGPGARTDQRGQSDQELLLRHLEAENLALRSWAVQLALQIQVLRQVGSREHRSPPRR